MKLTRRHNNLNNVFPNLFWFVNSQCIHNHSNAVSIQRHDKTKDTPYLTSGSLQQIPATVQVSPLTPCFFQAKIVLRVQLIEGLKDKNRV